MQQLTQARNARSAKIGMAAQTISRTSPLVAVRHSVFPPLDAATDATPWSATGS
jgi:hypothetical protein